MVEIAWTDDADGWQVDADLDKIEQRLLEAVADAVNSQADFIVDEAQRRAPVRKVFRDEIAGALTGGRTRRHLQTITATQLNREAPARRELGMPGTVIVGGRAVMSASLLHGERPYRTSSKLIGSQQLIISGTRGLARGGVHRFDDARRLTSQGGFSDPLARFLLSSRGAYEYRNAIKRGAVSVEYRSRSEAHASIGFDAPGSAIIRLGGRLRASIHRMPLERNGDSFSVQIIAGGPDAPYAKYVEFGTRHAPAQPFMRPAAAIARLRFPRLMQSELNLVKRDSTSRRLR